MVEHADGKQSPLSLFSQAPVELFWLSCAA
jgi:hypothetical protein